MVPEVSRRAWAPADHGPLRPGPRTFFNRGAVLYSVSKQRLISRASYFDRIRERVLDIYLKRNTTPLVH